MRTFVERLKGSGRSENLEKKKGQRGHPHQEIYFKGPFYQLKTTRNTTRWLENDFCPPHADPFKTPPLLQVEELRRVRRQIRNSKKVGSFESLPGPTICFQDPWRRVLAYFLRFNCVRKRMVVPIKTTKQPSRLTVWDYWMFEVVLLYFCLTRGLWPMLGLLHCTSN